MILILSTLPPSANKVATKKPGKNGFILVFFESHFITKIVLLSLLKRRRLSDLISLGSPPPSGNQAAVENTGEIHLILGAIALLVG